MYKLRAKRKAQYKEIAIVLIGSLIMFLYFLPFIIIQSKIN